MATLKMLILVILFIASAEIGVAQTQLKKDFYIGTKDISKSLAEYAKLNNIEYGLISWSISNWFTDEDIYNCLFKKNGVWFLARINAPSFGSSDTIKLKIKTKDLNLADVELIQKRLKINSTFKYKQSDFDNIKGPCYYYINGVKEGGSYIFDVNTDYLMLITKRKAPKVLTYYAAEFFYEHCYAHCPDFSKLRYFIKTIKELCDITNSNFNTK